ncbi:MAG: ribosome maturation factor RimM [Gammaproteobacteria bacterium]
MSAPEPRRVELGKLGGAFGIRGWVKLQSWTDPPEQIFEYRPWLLRLPDGWRECAVAEHRPHGKSLIARLPDIADREQAAALAGTLIAVWRTQLPAARPGEYYWADLVGLQVQAADGKTLGHVQGLMATGANDVLVVRGERERLIPFIPGQVVKEVDLDAGRIRVDWDPEF